MSSIHELKPLFKALVMSRGLRSRRVLAGLGLVCVLPLSAQVMAEDVSINIPAQPLPQALQAFGQQTNQQVIYNAADMAGLEEHPRQRQDEPADGHCRIAQGHWRALQRRGQYLDAGARFCR